MVWQRKKWPIKPDVVFEGGNSAKVPISKCSPREKAMVVAITYGI